MLESVLFSLTDLAAISDEHLRLRPTIKAVNYHQSEISSEWGNTFGAQSAALSLCRETFEVVTNFSRVLSNLLNFAHREEQDKCWEVFVEVASKAF